MRIRESKGNGISNCILAIALILGVSVTVLVSGGQAPAQNQGSSQMSEMEDCPLALKRSKARAQSAASPTPKP